MTRAAWWCGACWHVLTLGARPLGWKAWQRWRRGLIHARGLLACLAAIALWVAAMIAAGS